MRRAHEGWSGKPGPIIILALQQLRSLAKPRLAEVRGRPSAGSSTPVRQPGGLLMHKARYFFLLPLPSILPAAPASDELLQSLWSFPVTQVRVPSYQNWSLSFSYLVNMCRNRHRNQMFLSDAASWMNVFRTGISIHRSCPEEGLQGNWISRLYSIKTRRSKESTNVDLSYLFSALNLLHMGSPLRPALDLSPSLRQRTMTKDRKYQFPQWGRALGTFPAAHRPSSWWRRQLGVLYITPGMTWCSSHKRLMIN